MKTPTQNFAHHTEVKKHPFGVKTPILATLVGTCNHRLGFQCGQNVKGRKHQRGTSKHQKKHHFGDQITPCLWV